MWLALDIEGWRQPAATGCPCTMLVPKIHLGWKVLWEGIDLGLPWIQPTLLQP